MFGHQAHAPAFAIWIMTLPYILGSPFAALATLIAAKRPFQLISVCINGLLFAIYALFWFELLLPK
jgi:hypothetical protein